MTHAATVHDPGNDAWEQVLSRIQRPALIVGVVGIILTVIGLFIWPTTTLKSYLWAYLYWAAIPVGSLAFLMIQHMTGGTWGLVARRFFEASSSLVVLTAVFSLPLIIAVVMGNHDFYPWIKTADHPAQYGHHVNETHLAFKKFWLTPWFFILRTCIYFAIWCGLALYLYAWSGREDRSGSTPRFAFRARFVSGPGIVLGALSINFAFIDWVMTLDPQWYSTMFGVLYLVGSGLETMAFTILIIRLLADRKPLRDVLSPQVLNDLGNLMFAFTLLWAYVNFSQFLIMWSGNISEETPYYYFRNRGSWGAVALFIVIFHFFTPFLLLLWRRVKRDIRTLAMVALAVMIVRSVDLFWIVKPMFFQRTVWVHDSHAADEKHPEQPGEAKHDEPKREHIEMKTGHMASPGGAAHKQPGSGSMPPIKSVADGMNLFDIPAILGIGGIWVAAFAWRLKARPLVPPNDPRLAALAHGHH
jgi:hypothetical protein